MTSGCPGSRLPLLRQTLQGLWSGLPGTFGWNGSFVALTLHPEDGAVDPRGVIPKVGLPSSLAPSQVSAHVVMDGQMQQMGQDPPTRTSRRRMITLGFLRGLAVATVLTF